MTTQIGDQIDPRQIDDRIHAIEDRIERLSESPQRDADHLNIQRARQVANVARAASVIVLFIAVTSIGFTLRSNTKLRWEIFVERTRAQSLAKRVGDLSLQLAETRTELASIQQRLVTPQAPADGVAPQPALYTPELADTADLLANAKR